MSLWGRRDIHLRRSSWCGRYRDVSKTLNVIRVVMAWGRGTGSVGVIVRLVVVLIFLQ